MAKSKSSHQWLKRQGKDPYVQQAKEQGYRSRAAFKLEEIQEKHKLIKPGMQVLELGAAPGGWTQLLARWVGDKGHVYAIDLLDMDPVNNTTFWRGDIQDDALLADIVNTTKDGVDVVLSDMAPNMMGHRGTDVLRAYNLAQMADDAADQVLKPGGCFCIKLFHGAGFDAFVANMRKKYAKVKIYKPKASRASSSEVYLVALEKRE
jgi:23S rRNA (uridine2552-2'-O)-methyltransferase